MFLRKCSLYFRTGKIRHAVYDKPADAFEKSYSHYKRDV